MEVKMKCLSGMELANIVGGGIVPGIAVQITTPGTTVTTGNAQGLLNGVSNALAIVGYNPTPLTFQIVPK